MVFTPFWKGLLKHGYMAVPCYSPPALRGRGIGGWDAADEDSGEAAEKRHLENASFADDRLDKGK